MKSNEHGLGQGDDSMNKSDLISVLCAEGDLPIRKAEEIVNVLFDSMSKALISGDRIEIRGFGSFGVKEYKGYTGRNPKTGEIKDVDPKRLPFFKVGTDLRERVNQE